MLAPTTSSTGLEDLYASYDSLRSDRRAILGAIVETVISDRHIEKALAEHGAETHLTDDPRASIARLEARLKQLTRAEEILLERFGRGFITDAGLDKELVRLKADRTSVQEALTATQRTASHREQADRSAAALRNAISHLRGQLRTATTQDRRDIVRAIVAGGENGVKIGPERIEAEILLAPQGSSAFAQAYTADDSSVDLSNGPKLRSASRYRGRLPALFPSLRPLGLSA